MPSPELGARIRQARRAGGLTAEQLAVRVGVTHATIRRWESLRPNLALATSSPSAM